MYMPRISQPKTRRKMPIAMPIMATCHPWWKAKADRMSRRCSRKPPSHPSHTQRVRCCGRWKRRANSWRRKTCARR